MNLLNRILASSCYIVLIAVIAVIAVLFLREAVSWDGTHNLLRLGASLALMLGVLVFFLSEKSDRQG